MIDRPLVIFLLCLDVAKIHGQVGEDFKFVVEQLGCLLKLLLSSLDVVCLQAKTGELVVLESTEDIFVFLCCFFQQDVGIVLSSCSNNPHQVLMPGLSSSLLHLFIFYLLHNFFLLNDLHLRILLHILLYNSGNQNPNQTKIHSQSLPSFRCFLTLPLIVALYILFYCSLAMKGKDLITNIQQARQHINRLKKEAELLQTTPQDVITNNIHEYVNEVLYSLNKNELEIEKKHKEMKDKLPVLNNKKQDTELPLLNGYKKQRRRLNSTHKNKKEQSTKIQDNSFSFMVDNRQIKMHSFNEKYNRNDVTSDRHINSNVQITIESEVNRRNTPGSSQFRARHFDKKQLRAVDLLTGSKLAERAPQKNSKVSYMHSSSRPYIHQFQLFEGVIDTETAEFASYQRVYESIFPRILEQLKRLEEILKHQGVFSIRLDGKKLAYLCLKEKLSKDELLDCLIDLPARPAMHIRGKFSGKQGKIRAVNKIIAFWRMRSIRDKYQTLRKSTVTIQRFFKRQLLRLFLEKQIKKRNDMLMESFETRQNRFNKMLKSIRSDKRIQIHLSSVEMDEEKRLSIDHYQQRQNIQLSRIFRLRDESLIIIFISSTELSPQLLNYYYRMIELAGITNYRERLIFMTPQNASRLPQHLSTAKMLYYSSRTLNQLKVITSDLPTILFPGQPCNQLIKICHHLDCYLYSGQPQKMKCFSTKSQTKRLLKNLCIETLPSTMEMYDYGQFLNTFSVLIIKNPDIQTWVLKIDDQLNGRGIAYAELGASKAIKALLRKIDYTLEDGTFATQVHNQPQNQEVTVRIRDYIRDHLHERLQIATPTVYRNYTEFMGRFIKKGGVIEAHPPCTKEILSTVSVTFQLDPDGQHRILTSYEKINGQPFRPVACAFPQKILDYNQSISVIRQLCDSFKLRRMFGIFTIDFLVNKEEGKSWVIGIDPYMNDFSASFHIFDLLMSGSYLPQSQLYLVDGNSTEIEAPQDRLVARQYIFVPHLYHKNLGKVKIKDFFRAARLEQFNFDVGNKEGVCVTLLDQLASGVIGLLSVAESKDKAIERLKKMLDFISKISSVRSVDYGRSQLGCSSDGVSLKDVQSVFTGFVRKGARKDAKARAIKAFEMKKDLQLLV